MKCTIKSALLAVTLTIGCGEVAVAQSFSSREIEFYDQTSAEYKALVSPEDFRDTVEAQPPAKVVKRNDDVIITSIRDHQNINLVTANRGNCSSLYAYTETGQHEFPFTLNFGDQLIVGFSCVPIELEITSNGLSHTYGQK